MRQTATLVVAVACDVATALWPEGGQDVARRNAWTAMAVDTERSMARREADTVMARQFTPAFAGHH
jgi:hypothetical protein